MIILNKDKIFEYSARAILSIFFSGMAFVFFVVMGGFLGGSVRSIFGLILIIAFCLFAGFYICFEDVIFSAQDREGKQIR